jgi:hypothetical protein
MAFVRKGQSNGVFRKITGSTSFGAGGVSMISLTSTVNSGGTTATSGGTSTTITTISGSGVNTGTGIGFGGGGGVGVDSEIETLMNSSVFINISRINNNYSAGAFDLIKTELDQTLYNNYSLGLYNSKKPLNTTYEKVRKFINTNLEGLLQSINLYNTNTDVTSQRDAYKLIADKFNDPNELLSQLNMLRNSVSLFPDQYITVIPVEIKPEYLAYIKTYGYPENGIWDPDLLGAIIASISSANIE